MIVTLQTQGLQTLEQLRAFLEGSQPLGFEVASREAAYEFITQTLRHFRYARLGKADKGLVRRYLCKVTGCSRAQMIRRIAQFRATGRIDQPVQPNSFSSSAYVRPARTSSTICCRNSGVYSLCFFAISNTSLCEDEVSTETGQVQRFPGQRANTT